MADFIELYDIPFKGLETGTHHFGFDLRDSFFDHFDNDDSKGGSISIEAEMEKKDYLLSFSFTFTGSIRVICDRCLETFDMALAFESVLYVRFDEEKKAEDADVIYLDAKEHKLNIAEYFMESIRLNLPIKRIHPSNENGVPLCNREMLEKLEQHRAKENKEKTDPRWDSLKNLKDKKY